MSLFWEINTELRVWINEAIFACLQTISMFYKIYKLGTYMLPSDIITENWVQAIHLPSMFHLVACLSFSLFILYFFCCSKCLFWCLFSCCHFSVFLSLLELLEMYAFSADLLLWYNAGWVCEFTGFCKVWNVPCCWSWAGETFFSCFWYSFSVLCFWIFHLSLDYSLNCYRNKVWG